MQGNLANEMMARSIAAEREQTLQAKWRVHQATRPAAAAARPTRPPSWLGGGWRRLQRARSAPQVAHR